MALVSYREGLYVCGVSLLVSYREGVVCTIQASDGGDVSAGQLHGAAGGRSATPHITVRYAVRTQGAAYRESIQHCEIRRAHAGGSVQGGWVGRIFNGASYREGRACIHTRVCKMGGRACV